MHGTHGTEGIRTQGFVLFRYKILFITKFVFFVVQKVFCGFIQIFSVLRASGRTSRVSLLIGYVDCSFFTIGLKIAGSVFSIEMALKVTYFVDILW